MKKSAFFAGWRPERVCLVLFALAVFLLPSRMRRESVLVVAQGLVIQTSKSSPPRIAFHESLDRKPQQDSLQLESIQTKLATINLNEVLQVKTKLNGLQDLRSRKVVLEPMQVPREKAIQVVRDQIWMESLPAAQRQRIEEAQTKSSVMDQDWSLPSTPELISEKVREIQSQTFSKTQPQADNQTTQSKPKTVQSESANSPVVVSGDLAVSGGVAFVPDQTHFEVHWMEEGLSKGTGRVDLNRRASSYSISIPHKAGTIVAKIMDRNGNELGSGRFRLSDEMTEEQLNSAKIEISPRNQIAGTLGKFGEPASVARSIRKTEPASVLYSATGEVEKTENDGSFVHYGIGEGSWSFLRTNQKGMYSGLHLLQAGKHERVPLFEESFAKALLSASREARGSKGDQENGSIILGRVLQNGKPVPGIRIEVEGFAAEKPLHFFFKTWIPDTKATETSDSGAFVFSDFPKGFYSLRAFRGIQQVGIANVEVDDESISPVEIEVSPIAEKTAIKVYDAFWGSEQGANVEIQSLSYGIEVQGYAELLVPPTEGLNLIQVVPSEKVYAQAIYFTSGNQDYIHLPLIRLDWLQGLAQWKKVSDSPNTGTIVGFVPGDDFEIELTHVDGPDQGEVIYFDPQGLPVAKGVAGGGFVVLNVKAGTHTLLVGSKKSELIHSQILPVDAGHLQVVKFDF